MVAIRLYHSWHQRQVGSGLFEGTFLDAVKLAAQEYHRDVFPDCMCPVLAKFGQRINDILDDEERQLLLPLVGLSLGTQLPYPRNAGPDLETMNKRALVIINALIRELMPMAMTAVGWPELADGFAKIQKISNAADASRAFEAENSLWLPGDAWQGTTSYSELAAQSTINIQELIRELWIDFNPARHMDLVTETITGLYLAVFHASRCNNGKNGSLVSLGTEVLVRTGREVRRPFVQLLISVFERAARVPGRDASA